MIKGCIPLESIYSPLLYNLAIYVPLASLLIVTDSKLLPMEGLAEMEKNDVNFLYVCLTFQVFVLNRWINP